MVRTPQEERHYLPDYPQVAKVLTAPLGLQVPSPRALSPPPVFNQPSLVLPLHDPLILPWHHLHPRSYP